MKVRVTNIQRFSLQDGPGIRTTVFLKGCNLKCPWCANPENLSYEIQEYEDEGQKGKFGYDIELEELEKEILKDEKFYSLNNGGVTFSGGEPILQFQKLEDLLKKLKNRNINICVETALYVPEQLLDIALKYVDEFIVDLKILDSEQCKNVLNGDINVYYKNIERLFKEKQNIKIRIPVTLEYTLNQRNKEKIIKLLDKYKPKDVELFKIHRLAEKKYKVLGKEMIEYQEVPEEVIQNFLNEILKLKINAKICKI